MTGRCSVGAQLRWVGSKEVKDVGVFSRLSYTALLRRRR